MIAFVRKNLSCLVLNRTSPLVSCKSPVSFSLSLHFFSTSRESISPRVFDILLHKYDFPPELASRVASKLTDLENPEKADSMLSFFKESGFSNAQLQKIVKYKPRFLVSSLEDTIKPKFKIFQDLGFSSDAICKLFSTNPPILHISVKNNIIPSISVMKGLFGSNAEVARVLKYSSRFLTANLKSSVLPNIEFLKSCGIHMESIRTVISNFPNPFLLNPEIMRKCAEKAKEMGLDTSSKTFIYAIPTFATMSNEAWEVKLQAFRDLGFSDGDILTMFRQTPRSFCGSMEKIKKIIELLLATGKFDMSSIVGCPLSLAFSIEKRYKPRLQILGILESRGLIKKWPDLATICRLSDDMFFKTFISPYLNEVSDVDVIKSFTQGRKKMKH